MQKKLKNTVKKEVKNIFYFFISISLLGSLFIFSASTVIAHHYYQDIFFFYKKQIIGILLGIFTIIFTSRIKTDIIYNLAPLIYYLSLIINLFPFLGPFRYSINGASRWIKINGWVFQPSEILKIGYILYLCYLLNQYKDQKNYLFIFIFFNLGIIFLLLSKQSDFGTICILSSITFFLLWNFFYNKKKIIYFGLFCTIILGILIYKKSYRIKRLLIFFDPWKDPLGGGFQNIQSQIAISNGGFFGSGIGNSIQKNFFLPMPHTDFIFSIITEEIGFIGSVTMIALILIFSYIFTIFSKKIENIFQKYFLLSTTLVFFLQILINTGAATSLLPTKGIGFPCISYGISSLLGISLLVGIALSFID